MIGAVVLILFLFLITQLFLNNLRKKHRFLSKSLMNKLYFYHVFFATVYYIYAQFNPSDSLAYYDRPKFSDMTWLDFFGTSTTFIDFLSYPFINYLHFSYEMMMVLFAWLGYLGFLYAYLFFRENITIKVSAFKGVDFLTLILFLPNMHYWTASLGKGAPIFLGLMMFAYAIKFPKARLGLLIVSSCLIYYIRPHMFLFMGVGTVLGYMSGSEKISFGKKFLVFIVMIGTLLLVQDQILAVAGLEESEDFATDFQNFSENRSLELGKSGSGVDMSSYPLIFKLFTFWFRPLFIDATGVMGLIVSVENLIYLILFLKILSRDFMKFIRKSPIVVKMSLVVFCATSFSMTFIMSNLGIIIRQKSMVMYFLFFIIYYYLAQKKYDRLLNFRKLSRLREVELSKYVNGV